MPRPLTDLEGLNVSAEDFLAAVLETAAQPIWVVDPDDRIRFVNPAAVAALGYDGADELLGRHSHETIHYRHPDGTAYPAAECPMLVPRATGETVRNELDWFFRRDGSIFPVAYVAAPIAIQHGRGAVVAFTDIRERLRAEQVLREHDAVLARQQASLRRVAALVADGAASAEVFAAIAGEAAQLLRSALVHVWRFDPDGTVTVLGAWSERPQPFRAGTKWPVDRHAIARLVQESAAGRILRVDPPGVLTDTIAAAAEEFGIGAATAAPIVVGGEIWGAIGVGAVDRESMPDQIEERLPEFTELVATAILNMQARSELAASRARIVAAADEERRRVVRDLHDGAQQRLVHTVITLKLATQALQNAHDPLPALVTEALEQAERASTELRELAHGILPEVLTRGGLRASVDALSSRTPVPVENRVSVGRLPAPIEATAYFVVAESLTNMAKHARATGAIVTARIENGTLTVQVRDDGVGGARADGSGLVGLTDRLAALDGRLRVESPAGGGTLIAADIPLHNH